MSKKELLKNKIPDHQQGVTRENRASNNYWGIVEKIRKGLEGIASITRSGRRRLTTLINLAGNIRDKYDDTKPKTEL